MNFIATPNEAAQVLQVSPDTIRRICARGEWEHARKVGRSWRIDLTRQFPELGITREPPAIRRGS